MKPTAWKTAPISCTCEVMRSATEFCELPTIAAYPTQGGGWMALCFKHSLKHTEATKTEVLIARGETWA